jgi:hypothetical protein
VAIARRKPRLNLSDHMLLANVVWARKSKPAKSLKDAEPQKIMIYFVTFLRLRP